MTFLVAKLLIKLQKYGKFHDNLAQNAEFDREIPKERYISPEKID